PEQARRCGSPSEPLCSSGCSASPPSVCCSRRPSTLSSATSAPGEQNDPEASIRIGGMALILSTICPTASHNVPAVVLAGEADLVENEGVLHRGQRPASVGRGIVTLPASGHLSRRRA